MPTEFRLYNTTKEELYRNKSVEEKETVLLEMVQYALKYGNKPAARYYNTYPSTVRRWVKKYQEYGESALKYQRRK